MTDYHDFTTKDMPMKARRRLNVGDIWLNSAECRNCGETIVSLNRHDYKQCRCGRISVDGGSWYTRIGFKNPNDIINKIEMYDDADSQMLCHDCGEPLIPDLEATNLTGAWDEETYKGNCAHFQKNVSLSIG